MIDQILGNRYQITRQIGAGGMAWVYLAEDLRENRQVAIKVLYPQFAGDPTYVQRFNREAKIALGLVDEHLVSVLDYGADRDTQYLVMEHVEGEVLDAYLRARGALPWTEAIQIAYQVSRALEVADKLNIVHRDIKPQNLIRTTDGTIRVLDFGLARVSDLPSLTQSGFLGSPSHVSPEQATGKRTDIRSDIYSLGVVLYQMLAGHPPFEAENAWSVIGQHIASPLPPLRSEGSDIPTVVEETVRQMMAKDPDERYQTPAELSIHLCKILQDAEPATGELSRQSELTPPPDSLCDATVHQQAELTVNAAALTPEPIRGRYEESMEGGEDWIADLLGDEASPEEAPPAPESAETTAREETSLPATARPFAVDQEERPRERRWKQTVGIVAVLLLVVAGIWGFRTLRGTRDLNQTYQKAVQSIDARDWKGALRHLDWIIDRSPDFRDAGELRDRIRSAQTALAQFEEGLLYYQNEQWADAIAEWKPLLGLDGEWDTEALGRQICSAYRRQITEIPREGALSPLPQQVSVWTRIAELFSEAVQVCPDDEVLSRDHQIAGMYLDALQAWERQDWDHTVELLSELVDLHPTYLQEVLSEQLFRAVVQRGRARMKDGDRAGAEEDFRLALDMPVENRSLAQEALDSLLGGEGLPPKYPKPRLISPANEEVIGGGDGAVILLEWTPAPELAEDEFYNVTIMHFVDGTPVYWGDSVREPRLVIDRALSRYIGFGEADKATFTWWVAIKRDVDPDPNRMDGPSISQESDHRSFTWH